MRENKNNEEAVKNILEKLSKTLDNQNKEILHLTKFINKQKEFIKMLGGKLEKNDNKKSSQNNIQGSKKINRSQKLQDSIGAINSEIAEQDNRISKLKKVVKNNQDKIGSLLCSTSKKLSPDDLSKFCELIDIKRTGDKSFLDFINAYNKKLDWGDSSAISSAILTQLNQGADPDNLQTVCASLSSQLYGRKLDFCDLLTILDKLNPSGMQCIYKSDKEEVHGFKFDLSPCNFENGNKSIFKNQSNFGYQFNCVIPSYDNRDYKLGEDEK